MPGKRINKTDMGLNTFLKNSSARHPGHTCVVHGHKRLTYLEIDKLSDRMASILAKKGLRKGDRAAILLENSPEYIISFFGILKAGGAAVPLNTRLVSRELSHIISDSSPKFVITDSQQKGFLDSLMDRKLMLLIDKLDLSGTGEPRIIDRVSGSDLAMIIYTSGTTGKPKGVMLSHNNLASNAHSIIRYLKLKSDDKTIVILPFHYSYGTSLLTTHIKSGATLVIDNRFLFPNLILDTMEKEDITGLAGVPSNFAILLRKSSLRKYKLSRLRYVTQAGGALAASLIKEFTGLFSDIKFFVMYGQTEAAARLTYLEPKFLNKKIGSVGKAIPGVEIDILKEGGEKAKYGETGEIVARGPNVMLGYWNSPEETRAVLRKEGLYTGDLARLDRDGFIYLVSRKKEMIKCGASRVSPLEIEEVVCEMPGVLECAAVGIKDDILGEAIKLYVVKNGRSCNEKDILRFCKINFSAYKVPKSIEFVACLPKTHTGKIKRMELAKCAESAGR